MQNLKLDSDDQATKLRDPSHDFNKSQKTGSSKLMKLEITLDDDDLMPLPGDKTKARAAQIAGGDSNAMGANDLPLNQTIPETPLFSQFEERVNEKPALLGRSFIFGVGFFVSSAVLLALYAPYFYSKNGDAWMGFIPMGAGDLPVVSDLPTIGEAPATGNDSRIKKATNQEDVSTPLSQTATNLESKIEAVSMEPPTADLSTMFEGMTDAQLAEVDLKNPYWLLPNPRPGYLAGKMWSEEEQKIYYAGTQQRYVYQHFKAVQSLRQVSRNGAEALLLESLNHKKFWVRMEAALALIEQGRALSLMEQSKLLKDQRPDLIRNYLKRFVKNPSDAELYLTKSLLKFLDAPSRVLALNLILKYEKDLELKKLYILAATMDPASNIKNFANKSLSQLDSNANSSELLASAVLARKDLFKKFPDKVPSIQASSKLSNFVTTDVSPPSEIATAPTKVVNQLEKEEFDGFQEAVQFIRQAGEVIKSFDDGFDSLRATVRSDE